MRLWLRLELSNVNRNNTLLTAGLRFNEPLPLHIHNTMSLGYVRSSLSSQYPPARQPAWKTEQGVEFNTLLDVRPMLFAARNPVLRECRRRRATRCRFRIQNQGRVLSRVTSLVAQAKYDIYGRFHFNRLPIEQVRSIAPRTDCIHCRLLQHRGAVDHPEVLNGAVLSDRGPQHYSTLNAGYLAISGYCGTVLPAGYRPLHGTKYSENGDPVA